MTPPNLKQANKQRNEQKKGFDRFCLKCWRGVTKNLKLTNEELKRMKERKRKEDNLFKFSGLWKRVCESCVGLIHYTGSLIRIFVYLLSYSFFFLFLAQLMNYYIIYDLTFR